MGRRTYQEFSSPRFFGRRRGNAPKQAKGLFRRRLRLEHLENRCLLAVSVLSDANGQVSENPLGLVQNLYFPPVRQMFGDANQVAPFGAALPLTIAQQYLNRNATSFGLASGELGDYVVTSQYASQDTGVTHIYLQQMLQGLPVLNAVANVNVLPNGQVLSAGSSFLTGLNDSLTRGDAVPKLGAVEALNALANDLHWTLNVTPSVLSSTDGSTRESVLSASGISQEDIPAHLVFVPTAGGVELSWNLLVETLDSQHAYNIDVSADGGEILHWSDLVDNDSYNAFPIPTESPSDGVRSLIVNPADATASPYGWHDTNGVAGAEYTVTRGNNVEAYADRNNDGIADTGSEPSGSASLVFDFPLDLTQAPVNYQPAAVSNLFYLNNFLHDVHYQYGFTEAAGNFQVNNYGRGGVGNDDVRAEAQDGGGTNNANFMTPADGQRPRMQMYEFTSTTPRRDGDIDSGVVIHEFGHGVSNRLTGGPATTGTLSAIQSGGMGEGWSDWYALMFLQKPSDTQTAAYPMGT